jgi:hypothetical protein
MVAEELYVYGAEAVVYAVHDSVLSTTGKPRSNKCAAVSAYE